MGKVREKRVLGWVWYRDVDVDMMEVRRFNNVTMNEPSERILVYQLALFVPSQDCQWSETTSCEDSRLNCKITEWGTM